MIRIASQAVAATVEIFSERGLGSGFLVHPSGLVITAQHVIAHAGRCARTTQVRLNAGTIRDVVLDGTIFRAHRSLDYALLWLMEGGPYPYLPIGNPRALGYAQPVLAVGCPSGLSNTVSSGIVSNPAQSYRGVECIQTNADIDRGNSGGPLLTEEGVVGITVWGLGTISAAKFAIPIDYLTEDISRAISLGREACLQAAFCPTCGFAEFHRPTWFCRNCGSTREA